MFSLICFLKTLVGSRHYNHQHLSIQVTTYLYAVLVWIDRSVHPGGPVRAGITRMAHAGLGSGHSQVGSGHSQVGSGHSQVGSGHSQVGSGYSQVGSDHSQVESGHSQAGSGHSQVGSCYSQVVGSGKGSRNKKKSSSTSGRATKALPPTPPRA